MEMKDDKRLLIKVCKMYYEEDMTQSQIANATGIYRTTVGRMLKKAREEGIVKITIDDHVGTHYDLERELEQLLGLKEVYICDAKPEQTAEDKKKLVGKAGAEILKRVVKDGDTVGFAWGTTMAGMIGEFHGVKKRSASFVPLVGGPGAMDTKYHVNSIVYSIAGDFGGTPYFIDAAAVVEKKETKEEIVKSHYFKKIESLWNGLTVAAVGIGAPLSSSNMIWTGFYGDQDIERLEAKQAVGDICSRFFDRSGALVETEIHNRTIAIDINRLKNLEYSIGLAESHEKVPSIIGAAKGRYINILVTTAETAREIAEEVRNQL
ncbi:sugar-binding transcriptional regulator [Bacillus paralicheniformis]|uniref:sugar-binding transcriptional regulator n=1 Tax=Bacillus paralicheniformis TaxID=1648923 RepID=UPI00128B0F41|nr:sugar-binding transcriptional regulator [Bacillus paralicheniformis]MPQ23887.1 winged helix-turn-helix transcriptional regulator [Bacillus paralicheniformis]